LQAVLKNPIASPATLGIAHGAAFGAALAIMVTGMSRPGFCREQFGVSDTIIVSLSAFLFSLMITTVADYLLLGKKPDISWSAGRHDEEVVIEALKRLHLEEFALRSLFEMSSGELQKVALARALVQEPEIVMLDEPTGNLDLKNQREVMELINEEITKRGLTALVAMHDVNLALRFGTAFTLLKGGRILAVGGREAMTLENLRALYGIDVQMQSFGAHTVVFA
jgi:iron complex transport system ATP-binding protein